MFFIPEKRGFKIFSPFDSVANDSKPTSTPTTEPSLKGNRLLEASAIMEINILPVDALRMVKQRINKPLA
jgi:hypothetical protein